MSATRLRATLLACSLAACACGESEDPDAPTLGPPERRPIPGCEAFDPAPCDVLTEACQERLLGIAACLRGSEAGDLPPMSIKDEAEFEDYLRESYAMLEPDPDEAHYEAAFAMLGLAAPGSFGDDESIARAVANIGGLYDWDTQSILLVDHGEHTDEEAASAILVHELVHALQDRDVNLRELYTSYGTTLDGEMAVDAVVEGEADFHRQHYLASMLGFDPAEVDWDALFQNGVALGERSLLEAESPLLEASYRFPYLWGSRYIHLGWPATGREGVLALLTEPPSTTHELMASVEELVPDDFEPSVLAPPVAPPEWLLVEDDRLGAAGVFEFFGRLTDVNRGRALALDWRGDALGIFKGAPDVGTPDRTVVTWCLELADATSAGFIETSLVEVPGAYVRVDGTRVRIAFTNGTSDLSWAFLP